MTVGQIRISIQVTAHHRKQARDAEQAAVFVRMLVVGVHYFAARGNSTRSNVAGCGPSGGGEAVPPSVRK